MAVNLLSPLAVPLVLAAVAHLVVAALLPVHLVVLVVANEAVPFSQSGPESRLVSALSSQACLKERSCLSGVAQDEAEVAITLPRLPDTQSWTAH